MDYKEVEESIEVPKNTGRHGFLRVVEDILKKPRVQDIRIDARGKVTYRYFVREGEEQKTLGIDFETLAPYAAIRNGVAVELAEPSKSAATAIGQLFDHAAFDHLFPVAFVGGKQTKFWDWYVATTHHSLTSHETLFGLPFLTDRMIPDEVLVLTSAFSRGATLIDTQKSYKIVIPSVGAT